MPGLTPEQVRKIHDLLHDKQLIQAVHLYHQATGVSLAEARDAVEEMARNEYAKPPSGRRNYDDPVLESKIISLLSKGRKKDAIEIYRAEYGVTPNEAKKAVERIESSMPHDPATSRPYQSAIGKDPFAEDDAAGRRRFIVLGVVLAVALCGLAGFLLTVMVYP